MAGIKRMERELLAAGASVGLAAAIGDAAATRDRGQTQNTRPI
jgi:hypothetical protein